MALNIKNEEAVALARQLAAETGESLTAAVTGALHERLERIRREQDHDARIDRLWADAQQLRRELEASGGILTDDDLYDPATGLPR